MRTLFLAASVCAAAAFFTITPVLPADAEVCNLKVVTDASPDYSDMDSMVRSITGKWPTMKEKCWAMFYWVHLARRQTRPMMLHGMELGDPIRQFNDYGYAMCSTVAGINDAIWNRMGMKIRFRDISMHTVSECYYDNAWHIYDDSMSALYTLCDGTTIAGVDDVGKDGACAASGGKVEPGHIAKYHCLTATSANGFLTGSDGARTLGGEAVCFQTKGLKYYPFWCGWEDGHRYILNLRDGEAYTRHYRRLDKPPAKGPDGKPAADPESPKYYVPNYDDEKKDKRLFDPELGYNIRGNGRWVFKPSLAANRYKKLIWAESNIAAAGGALMPAKAGEPASVTFRVNSANVATSMSLLASLRRATADDAVSVSISTTNGLAWTEVWEADAVGDIDARIDLLKEVNGAYETLIRFDLLAKNAPADAALKGLEARTVTMVNAKTQPKLNLGKNVIYVGAGDPTDSIVYWPNNNGQDYKVYLADSSNIACGFSNWNYYGNLHPVDNRKDAWLVYRLDAPGNIRRVVIGGRFSNRWPKNHIDLLWSADEGKNWTLAWTIATSNKPWDTLHHETVAIPQGHRTVWVKYLMSGGSSIFSTRIEAQFAPADAAFKPIEVTFAWKERQADRSLVERSHTQLVPSVPFRYEINVGGADHPVMESLQVNLKGSAAVASDRPVTYGYSDGKDRPEATKFLYSWATYGRNFAQGKPYKTSVPSRKMLGAAGPDSGKLTDGVVGPFEAGGLTPRWGEVWAGSDKEIDFDVDLGIPQACGAFRIHMTSGWPWPESVLKGDWKDTVELFTSLDGATWTSRGFFKLNFFYKDVAINYMLPDWETLQGYNFELILPAPVATRYVRWRLHPNDHTVVVTELQAMDFIKYVPFDIRLALPDEPVVAAKIDPATLTPPFMDPRDKSN